MAQCWTCQQDNLQWSEVTKPNKYGIPKKFLLDPQSGLPHDCNQKANSNIRKFQQPSYTTEQFRIMRMDRQNRAEQFDPWIMRYPSDLFILKGFDDKGFPIWERNPRYHDKDGRYIFRHY